MLSTGSIGNPIVNLSCNWDIVLIFDVLMHSLGLFDRSFKAHEFMFTQCER